MIFYDKIVLIFKGVVNTKYHVVLIVQLNYYC